MIFLEGRSFKDEAGRTRLLRGVNLGGSSKVPRVPDGATWNKAGFYDSRDVSFVGRPFPLAEADEHFSRLRAWGFTFIRFLITWEAIEHGGPGIYDEAYLDYLHAVLKKAGEYDLEVLIDPHQDAWSRFSGGDGAPGWTLELAGFDLTRLHASGAAILHQEQGDPLPGMIWPTNYNKLAAATMFTLFFAGSDFAPRLTAKGVPIQEYLQRHYIQAIQRVALRLKDLPNVIGYEVLNEPSNGYIGERDICKRAEGVPVFIGETPTIFQGMLMGAGYAQRVDVYKLGLTGFRKTGTRLGNPQGVQAWLAGREDVWRQHGVWGLDAAGEAVILRSDYFSQVNGRAVDFHAGYFKPFANRFAREICSITPEAIIFIGGAERHGKLNWEAADAERIVYAPHWYDGLTLMSKAFLRWLTVDPHDIRVVLGTRRVRQCLAGQVARLMRQAETHMRGAPVLIGEVGIPFDMQNKRAYRRGDFGMQVEALDATMQALEANLASFTWWNYSADNTNERGDQWNDEDLSLFSRDQMSGSGSIHDGGRALRAAVRPYACKVAGEPLRMYFDIRERIFEFAFRHVEGVEAPTEIFIPEYQYPQGCKVQVSDGRFELERDHQRLLYWHTSERERHTLQVRPNI